MIDPFSSARLAALCRLVLAPPWGVSRDAAGPIATHHCLGHRWVSLLADLERCVWLFTHSGHVHSTTHSQHVTLSSASAVLC